MSATKQQTKSYLLKLAAAQEQAMTNAAFEGNEAEGDKLVMLRVLREMQAIHLSLERLRLGDVDATSTPTA